ncbi:enoyl-CoA hydratase/isomerase family protein [Bacillus sp. AFS017336]|uniref:enoyl-CoA hydratase/isomerase family protein n=1 Tax=Bacillus sp. AFS017336 TaxID=2033489 RepID=UPI000BF1D334|nr:enoyl-CoA hydratase [Bacillus sp. AFS017336]PEL13252.1 enoyl-CoA hydratase [Bacillus sp. AFS017336]
MSNQHLLVEVKDRILTLTLNRPESLNSFSHEMLNGIVEALNQARNNPEIKVIVLSGAGRSFSAGGDVKTMGQVSPNDVYEHIGVLNTVIKSIRELEKPVIASVHGFAAGAGFNLALACDLLIAANDSKFALSFSQVGLISDGGGSYFLPRLIGPYLAKQFFFTAEPVSAERMYQLGVANSLVPVENLAEETMKFANKIAAGPGKATGMMKKLIDQSFTSTLDEMLELERITQPLMVATEDHQEGVTAFKEKRKAIFTGK